ncbi:MAG: GNAT family N-acetyltransferase [Clostridiales bacterium]|nr:GNAT family N-acetyltransferase [Clostridiales bacterium]
MLRLRPYKPCDAERIAEWVQDEDVFHRWGGDYIGSYPLPAEAIDDTYRNKNGNCDEADNFYPWTAVDEDNRPVGSFIMRYTGGDPRQLRFGWVVVDDAIRGKGYGRQMLELGLKYAFELLGAERITIGVFEGNEGALRCYRKTGFTGTGIVKKEPRNVIEMEMLKKDFFGNR